MNWAVFKQSYTQNIYVKVYIHTQSTYITKDINIMKVQYSRSGNFLRFNASDYGTTRLGEKEKHWCFVPITSVVVEVTFSSGL